MSAAQVSSKSSVSWIAGLVVILCATGLSPAAAQDPVIDSADPPAAEQETLDLNVTILGDNFGPDSEVFFWRTGTEDPGGIKVKKVKVRNPRRLVATIDVALDAAIDQFDIEVLSRGRRGKGTELFRVLEKTDPSLDDHALLARTDFEAGHAVSRDASTVSCDGSVLYHYADQHDTCLPVYEMKSTIQKNGGRWMFYSRYPLENPAVARKLRVDFNHDLSGGCQGVVDYLLAVGHQPVVPLGSEFDIVGRITADRLFKDGATRQSTRFELLTLIWDGRRILKIEYINPLFICDDPDPSVRLLQTMSCEEEPFEDVSRAEVWEMNGPSKKNQIKLGECDLPMKIQVESVECTALCSQ